MDFVDAESGVVYARNVPVSPVAGQPSSGTAVTVVTLSSGQYGSELYNIKVVPTLNYADASPSVEIVTVTKPAAANEITGGGTIAKLSTAAGTYGVTSSGDASFSIGISYNKSMTNLQGKISIAIPQSDGSIIVIKTNNLTSMSVTGFAGGKYATVYGKASIVRVKDGIVTSLGGNLSFRMDVTDNNNATVQDEIGFTIFGNNSSDLLYSNNWVNEGGWMTKKQAMKTGGSSTLIGG